MGLGNKLVIVGVRLQNESICVIITFVAAEGRQLAIMSSKTDAEKLALIAANIRRENEREEIALKDKVKKAYKEVDRLVSEFLASDPKLEKIVLFGSLAENRVVSLNFDIDLAVCSNHFLKLVACGLKSPFRVDVVDLERVTEGIKQSISKYGKVLYEKKG